MKRTAFAVCLLSAVAIVGFMASPFLAAYEIRHALKSGDRATLDHRIDWASVRAGLKASFASAAVDNQPSGLWSRLKGVVKPIVASQLVDRYVTPERLPEAFGMRAAWRAVFDSSKPGQLSLADSLVSTQSDVPEGMLDRLADFNRRIKRASFLSLTEVEFEIEDRKIADRRYLSRMEFKRCDRCIWGIGWKLVDLRVLSRQL
jgi:Protein of unknown function (DUF2939)